MNSKFLFSFSLIALVTLTTNAQKLALTKGQKVETITTSKMNMEMMGQSIDNESSATTSIELKDVTNDGYVFNNTITRLTTKVTGAGQDVSFDSNKKEDMDGQIGQALKDKIGNVQEIQVDKQGKVSGKKEDKAAAAGMSDMMSMTGDLAKGQAFPILIQLPAKKLKPGDSWIDSTGSPASIKTVITYVLKSVTADGVQVSFTGNLAKSGTVQQNGMDIQIDMTGTLKGEAAYETNSGILKTSSTTSDIQGSMGIMGQNVPLNATVSANIVAKKL